MTEAPDTDRVEILSEPELGRTLVRLATQVLETVDDSRSLMLLGISTRGVQLSRVLARELERIALEDDYFVQRKLYPNVDFYSGIILKAMGFPTEMFTVLFALARTVGWISQWKEMMENPDGIFRPRQLYTGEAQRPYISLDQR